MTMDKSFAIEVSTPDIRLSGWQSLANQSAGGERGLIVALHGGGYNSRYWNYASPGEPTFAELATALGFHLLALDRPGYGASQGFSPARLTVAEQATMLFDAIDVWCTTHQFAGPVCLIGHSLGGIISLVMAAHARSSRLTAVDVLGVPFRYAAGAGGALVQSFATPSEHIAAISRQTSLQLMFGPEGSYDPAALQHLAGTPCLMPVAEYRDGIAAPALWPQLLPTIRIPVQFTVAEYEAMQETGWAVLEEVRKLLANSRHAVMHLQTGSAHNASLHYVAVAYHLRAIAFFEECIALCRRAPGSDRCGMPSGRTVLSE